MNTAIPPVPLPPRQRSQTPLWVVCGVLIVLAAISPILIFLGIGVVASQRTTVYRHTAETLPREMAGARRERLAMTIADLRPTAPVPESRDAAPLYRKIGRMWKSRPESERTAQWHMVSDFLKPSGRTPANLAKVRSLLATDADLIRLAEQASTLPYCDLISHSKAGIDGTYPETFALRDLARLFAARAILERESGQLDAALHDIATGARIGVHAGQNPTVIAFLTKLAIDSLLNRPFMEVLQQYGNRVDVLRQADETEKAFGPAVDARSAYRGELVTECALMDMVRRAPGRLPGDMLRSLLSKSGSVASQRMMADAWESRMIAFWRECDRELTATHGDLRQEMEVMARLTSQDRQHWSQPGYEMNAILMPVFEKDAMMAAQTESYRRLRIGTVALLRFRAAHGRFPDALSELPSAGTIMDPFTDTSCIYRRQGNGFLLYSVGPNLKDDGGDETKDANGFTHDIVVRYP